MTVVLCFVISPERVAFLYPVINDEPAARSIATTAEYGYGYK